MSNFRTDYHRSSDDNFGVKLDNGSWNGVVGLVVRGEVHISNSAFMYNAPRMEVVDYLDPMSSDRYIHCVLSVWARVRTHVHSDMWPRSVLITVILLVSSESLSGDVCIIRQTKLFSL
jgi:hypothetical protein